MNGSTAKLLRRYSHISGHPYRDLKRLYKEYPWTERYALKQEIRQDIQRLKQLKKQQTTIQKKETEARNFEESLTQTVPRSAAEPSKLPVEKQAWWQAAWEWLKQNLNGLFN